MDILRQLSSPFSSTQYVDFIMPVTNSESGQLAMTVPFRRSYLIPFRLIMATR